ncbi:MAG: prolipoprotein diacylglyceryl transferase [Bryobacteraceae bacterium]|jgi:phosphatidylglycerol:prolipoprotein diacylglycerol transferase
MYPELFRIGNFFLPTYGVLVALGFLAALWVVSRLGRRSGLDPDTLTNLGIYVAIAGLAGAKALMILLDLPTYIAHPGELFSLDTLQAAGIFYGGFLAALATAILYMRRHKLPVLATMDVFAPAVALGHAIGRVGCFAAGCCWGGRCDLPWAVTFTSLRTRTGVPLGIPLHPAQLYEAFAEAIIFTVLYRRFLKTHRPGAIIGLYLVLYPAARFFVEFVRAHDDANPYFGPFVLEQWIALALIAAGVSILARSRGAAPKQPGKA